MGQFDNPKSITLLFTGAFLLSLGIIAFLNVEIRSRSNHGTKIKNENMFETLGQKISQAISSLRKRNDYRSTLYQIFLSRNFTGISNRKLLHYLDKSEKLIEGQDQVYLNRTQHRLRHEKKMRKLGMVRLLLRNHSLAGMISGAGSDRPDMSAYDQSNGNNITGFLKMTNNNNDNNQTRKWFAWTGNNKSGNNTKQAEESGNAIKENLGVHLNCYTTNDVLEIIAITCLVNFVFWFIVISCVNVFTRNQKISKFDSCESLASMESSSEYEIQQTDFKKNAETSRRNSVCRHSFVQDYVNSLDPDAGYPGISDHKILPRCKENDHSKKTESIDKCRRSKIIHFSDIFSEKVSLDNLKSFARKKQGHRDKKIATIVNSLSMEDLLS